MKRALAALLVAGLLLGACGTISEASAMSSWASESGYLSIASVLLRDASHSVTVLQPTHPNPKALHTVCQLLFVDTASAESSLPTPDARSTTLLARAYHDFAVAASTCYGAANDPDKRLNALAQLTAASGYLSEASARVASISA